MDRVDLIFFQVSFMKTLTTIQAPGKVHGWWVPSLQTKIAQ